MLFIGIDLTSAFARCPRPIDVAILDDERRCRLKRIAWPEPDVVRNRNGDALWHMLKECLEADASADAVWAIDGPQGLADQGATIRDCERRLRTAGKTPSTLPSDRPGGKPYEQFLRSSVDLFGALIRREGMRLAGLETNRLDAANLFEVYPASGWTSLAGRKLPRKGTTHGGVLRRELLVALRIADLPEPLNHDQSDACVAAYLAWCTRHAPDTVELIGLPPRLEDTQLREGYILHAVQRGEGGAGRTGQPHPDPLRGRDRR